MQCNRHTDGDDDDDHDHDDSGKDNNDNYGDMLMMCRFRVHFFRNKAHRKCPSRLREVGRRGRE